MRKRPIAVTAVAVVLIITGIFEVIGDYLNFRAPTGSRDDLWVGGVNLLAIVAGVFILRGRNWARWLAMAWMTFHVAISFFNSVDKVLVHSIILALFAWGLFRGAARTYFGNRPLSM